MKSLRLFFIAVSLLIKFTVVAQDDIPVRELPKEIFREVKKDPNDTSQWRWKKGGLFNLNLSQGSLSNWAAGGDNYSLSLNTYVNYYVLHKHPRHTWDNNLDFYFGFIQTTSLGSRKNDDRLDYISKYGYSLDTSNKIYVSALFNFRSQLFDGRTYFSRDSSELSSTILSPAYFLLSLGFDYKPLPNLSIFVSPITNRLTVVANTKLATLGKYGVDSGNHFYYEPGAFASINYFENIIKNVSYKGRLDLFSNYRHNPLNVDIYITNIFSFKINRFLSATYNLDIIYDDDVKLFGKNSNSPRMQLKSLIGIGLLFPFAQSKN
jgi:hypothetical protein